MRIDSTPFGFSGATKILRGFQTIIGIILFYLMLAFTYRIISWFAITLPSTLHPLSAVPLALGIVYGANAVWGVSIAYVVVQIVGLSASIETPFVALAHLYLALAGYTFWQVRNGALVHGHSPLGWLETVKSYIFISVIVCPGAAAISAWGFEVGGIAPFFVTVVSKLIEFWISSILLGLPLLVVLLTLTERTERMHSLLNGRQLEREEFQSSRRVVVITGIWVMLGFLGSIGYRIFERIPRYAFRAREMDWIYEVGNSSLLGPGGARLQILLGAIMFSLLLLCFMDLDQIESGGSSEVNDATDSS